MAAVCCKLDPWRRRPAPSPPARWPSPAPSSLSSSLPAARPLSGAEALRLLLAVPGRNPIANIGVCGSTRKPAHIAGGPQDPATAHSRTPPTSPPKIPSRARLALPRRGPWPPPPPPRTRRPPLPPAETRSPRPPLPPPPSASSRSGILL